MFSAFPVLSQAHSVLFEEVLLRVKGVTDCYEVNKPLFCFKLGT